MLVVDSREQRPYGFDATRVRTVRAALPAGDYSLAEYEQRVAVERKTLNDLVTTVIHDRERFKAELEKLATYDAACIVAEADLRDLLEQRYHGRAHPNSVVGSLIAIAVDFRIPVFFCGDRDAAERFTQGYLLRYWKRVNAGQEPVVACEAKES